jgi:hypothetical protein
LKINTEELQSSLIIIIKKTKIKKTNPKKPLKKPPKENKKKQNKKQLQKNMTYACATKFAI